jgi:hypothetical protein
MKMKIGKRKESSFGAGKKTRKEQKKTYEKKFKCYVVIQYYFFSRLLILERYESTLPSFRRKVNISKYKIKSFDEYTFFGYMKTSMIGNGN